jgi:hypothetical protein
VLPQNLLFHGLLELLLADLPRLLRSFLLACPTDLAALLLVGASTLLSCLMGVGILAT